MERTGVERVSLNRETFLRPNSNILREILAEAEELLEFAKTRPAMRADFLSWDLPYWQGTIALDAASKETGSPSTGGWVCSTRPGYRATAFRVPNAEILKWIPDGWKETLLKDDELAINIYEFLVIIGVVVKYQDQWEGTIVEIWSDNQTATAWANGSARPKAPWRKLSGWLMKQQTKGQFRIKVHWVSTHANVPADTISRVPDQWVWVGGFATKVNPNDELRRLVKSIF